MIWIKSDYEDASSKILSDKIELTYYNLNMSENTSLKSNVCETFHLSE